MATRSFLAVCLLVSALASHDETSFSAIFAGPAVQETGAKLQADTLHWYPVRLEGNEEDAVLHLQQFSSTEHTQLLKPDSRQIGKASGPTRRVPLREFVDEVCDTPALTMFVMFKVARCGSILLDKMLAVDPRFKLVAEPPVLSQVPQVLGSRPELEARRLRTYRALLLSMAAPLTLAQEVAWFDLQSITSWHMSEVARSVPEAHRLFLWRQPLEVAESLYKKPSGWLRRIAGVTGAESLALVPAIRQHMELIVAQLNRAEAELREMGVTVFWYQQVLDGTLVLWVMQQAFPAARVDAALVARMNELLKYDSKTGEALPNGFYDYDEVTMPQVLLAPGQIRYNYPLTHFKTVHAAFSLSPSQLLPVLRWPEDREQVVRHLIGDLSESPMVVRNSLRGTGLENWREAEVLGLIRRKLAAPYRILAATAKENFFVYHKHAKEMKKLGYHVFSEWRTGRNLTEVEGDPATQVVQSLKSNRGKSLDDFLAEKLMVDSSIHEVIRGLAKGEPNADFHGSLRVSHEGAVTALHFDECHSTLMQLSGVKEIVLWPKTDLERAGAYPRSHVMHRRLLADPEHLDSTNLPDFRLETAVYAVLERGDLAYWPSRWPHYIRTVRGMSVSIGKRILAKASDDPPSASEELIRRVEATRYAKGRPELAAASRLT